jgi:hypothetical protein
MPAIASAEANQRTASIASAAGNYSPLDCIQHEIELLPHVLCEEAQNKIAVLLEQLVFSAIAPVGLDAPEMVGAVQLYGQPSNWVEQIDFHSAPTVKRDRQLGIEFEAGRFDFNCIC